MMATVLNRRNRTLGWVVGAVLISLGLWGGVAHIIPFKPFTIHGYAALPDAGCPGIPLDQLKARYSLIVPPYATVGPYRLKTNWERVNVVGATDLLEFRGSFADAEHGRRLEVVTPHLRIAPPDAGNWRIYSEFVIYGRVLGWPRQQIIPGFRSDNVYHAFSPGTGDCP